MKKHLARIFMVLGGLLMAAAVLELVLRVTDRYEYNKFSNDPASGLLVYTPGITFTNLETCFESPVRVNNLGFHGPDVTKEKTAHVFRIAVVGSSFAEAAQVPLEKMYSTRLQERLNAEPKRTVTYEVLPFGFSGNGTYLDMLYYLRFVTELHPDLVIDLTTEYELSRNVPNVDHPPRFDAQGKVVLELASESRSPVTTTLKNVLRRSKLMMNLYNRYLVIRQDTQGFLAHPVFFGSPPQATTSTSPAASLANQELWPTEETLLKTFAKIVHDHSSRFLLTSWATPYADPIVRDALHAHLSSVATAEAFPYLDLVPALATKQSETGKSASWSCDGHWNEEGNTWVAETLADFLTKHRDLITP